MEFIAENLKKIFTLYPQIKLVYFFGSKARGTDGPLSDFDFALYMDERDARKRLDIRTEIMAKVSQELQTDAVDVVILNDVKSPEVKYRIIQEGKILYEQEPFKVLLIPRILTEYFDFIYGLRKYGLTKA